MEDENRSKGLYTLDTTWSCNVKMRKSRVQNFHVETMHTESDANFLICCVLLCAHSMSTKIRKIDLDTKNNMPLSRYVIFTSCVKVLTTKTTLWKNISTSDHRNHTKLFFKCMYIYILHIRYNSKHWNRKRFTNKTIFKNVLTKMYCADAIFTP